ncbi:transaldolase [Reinekea blandensis]|uniref:transaldolase n=1 Tax=Reinekea blandensis MED297 TaxID=314283 RepID=A4BF99_9GAMM|nr:transaldolase [Reinekea sp. MED297] [Reinekea blandensis MED297]
MHTTDKKSDVAQTQLAQLRAHSVVVADTGDVDQIRRYQPTDVTTNPSLILKAANGGNSEAILRECVAAAKAQSPNDWQDDAIERVSVAFGVQLSKLVPGYVSTEVNARFSFDTEATVAAGKRLIQYYRDAGVDPERILIKVAGTWEGIEAARRLEADGIRCNVTLIFHAVQAAAAAKAGAFLISPFVGRIQDWYKQNGQLPDDPALDPGVQSVRGIWQMYRALGYDTVVMAASFRSVDQVLRLAGCDRLTISPALLAELDQNSQALTHRIDDGMNEQAAPAELAVDEASFRWQLNEDPMATEKLSEGIRLFNRDHATLAELLTKY